MAREYSNVVRDNFTPDEQLEPVLTGNAVVGHTSLRYGTPECLASPVITASWTVEKLPGEIGLQRAGCTASSICSAVRDAIKGKLADTGPPSRSVGTSVEEIESDKQMSNSDHEQAIESTWRGWAEIENDPGIFTILLREWGVPNLQVDEIIDIAHLFDMKPHDTFGLIFLSPYASTEQSSDQSVTPVSDQPTVEAQNSPQVQPWFANQISKFSCGTVALMNILMNSQDKDLSESLSRFRITTTPLSSKDRGIALDEDPCYRSVHNSFSTMLDRLVVDVLVKEEAQKHQAFMRAQMRQVRQQQKRKRTLYTRPKKKKKKKLTTNGGDDESGFHFVAYVSDRGSVWKLDGLQPHPSPVGQIGPDQTWLNLAAGDLMARMQEAFDTGEECSLMSISRVPMLTDVDAGVSRLQREEEKVRKQEDWAPFVEHMLRLHAEKGDLRELLGL